MNWGGFLSLSPFATTFNCNFNYLKNFQLLFFSYKSTNQPNQNRNEKASKYKAKWLGTPNCYNNRSSLNFIFDNSWVYFYCVCAFRIRRKSERIAKSLKIEKTRKRKAISIPCGNVFFHISTFIRFCFFLCVLCVVHARIILLFVFVLFDSRSLYAIRQTIRNRCAEDIASFPLYVHMRMHE